MKALKVWSLATLFLLPALGFANTDTTRCYAAHFVRGAPPGDEMRFTVIFFNNGDRDPAVVERFTVRDDEGNIIHDSGPKIGVPHPLANGPVPPQDITTVPPGGVFSLSTTDIWGFNNIPQYQGRGLRSISVTVEMATSGDRKQVVVHAREIARQRFFLPTPPFAGTGVGAERAANDTACFPVKELKD
jgi:hypothetical protein